MKAQPRKFAHSGYHWNYRSGRFFEGWYYRLILPEQSFAFMYAIDDPQGGTRFSGGSVQVLGADDQHIWRTLPKVKNFQASRDRLELSHWNSKHEGYAASDRYNSGRINNSKISCTWDYQIQAVSQSPSATMGWLSYLPVFAPGWQVLMMHGWGSGFVTWGDRSYEFQNAPVYMEKNWGGAFPEQWFWIQCNAFDGMPDLSLVSAGGKRKTLGISSDVAMVSIYSEGEIYRFMPDNSEIYCEVKPWGSWEIRAYNDRSQSVEIRGETNQLGTWIMVPTESGLQFKCRDTAIGKIKISLNANGKTLHAQSSQAALEVGGAIWAKTWKFKSAQI